MLDDDPLDTELMDKIYLACMQSRVWFAINVLEIELEEWQLEVLEALDRGETRISIRSGHGVGKTMLCAIIALHFLLFRDDVKVVVTAPSANQMKDGLIPEIKKWIQRLPDFLREQIDATEERIKRMPDGANNFVSFRTARAEAPEALAGIHATHVLAIVDEASGVPEPVYEAAAGTMSTAGAVFILIGNPTRPKGFFYKTHTSLKSWWTRRVSCFDSTRVDQAFIQDIIDAYGKESRQYYVRVLGEFPPSSAEGVIPKELVDTAIGREVSIIREGRVWGIDPGRGGDPTGFCDRSANAVLDLAEWHDTDLMKVVGRVVERWQETAPDDRPDSIYVDSIGIGAGVADRLRELDLPVIEVNVSESPALKDRYPKLRAELWYTGLSWFSARNVTLPPNHPLLEKFVDELIEPEAVYTSTGKNDVESKSAMKQRGVQSPNLADAFMMTFAGQGAIGAGRATGKNSWKKPLAWSAPSVY